MLFDHQQEVFKSLLQTARVCFGSDWQCLPIRPRFARFVSGPSGAGKTHVARAVAEELDLPFFAVDASTWIPLGASSRGATFTWVEIGRWLRDNPRGIIFLDELDKVGSGPEGWLNYVRVEIFSLLDRRLPAGLSLYETDDDDKVEHHKIALGLIAQRLCQGVLIIGAGAFQSVWESRGKPVAGFHGQEEKDSRLTHRQMTQAIPTEMVNRFTGPILVLEQLSKDDYAHMLRRFARSLPKELAGRVESIGRKGLEDAVDNRLGVRWLEEILLRALSLPEKAETKAAEASPKLG
jgi:hypothetical protein